MVFIVRQKPHPDFERQDNDLIYRKQISLEMVRQLHNTMEEATFNALCIVKVYLFYKGIDWFCCGGEDTGWKTF